MQRITRRGFRHLMSRISAEEIGVFTEIHDNKDPIDLLDLTVLVAVIVGKAELEMFGEN